MDVPNISAAPAAAQSVLVPKIHAYEIGRKQDVFLGKSDIKLNDRNQLVLRTVAPENLSHLEQRHVGESAVVIRLRCRDKTRQQAEELAHRLKISRSSLDKRFKRSIGRTVDRDIRRARLERATELLTRTNLPLRKVARESGYGNEQYLNAVMRATFHCTPMQYRLKHHGRW